MTDDLEIVMTRTFNAPRELVWKAWTDPEHLRQWWGPFGPEHTTCDIDFRIGGTINIMMKAQDGNTYPAKAEFIDIVAPERIVYEGAPDAPTACGAGLPPRARVTVLFEALREKTRLTIDTRFPDEDALIAANAFGYETSWTKTLDALSEKFEEGAFGGAEEAT